MVLEDVFVRCADRLYRLALRITGVREDAEAVVAEALGTVPPTKRATGPASALERWLFLRVAQVAYARLRKRRAVPPIAVDDVVPALDGDGQHFEPMDDWSVRIADDSPPRGRQQALSAAIDALPPDSRTALILHDVEEVPPLDIAEILGIDVRAAKLHVHRARLSVRQRLSAYFASTVTP